MKVESLIPKSKSDTGEKRLEINILTWDTLFLPEVEVFKEKFLKNFEVELAMIESVLFPQLGVGSGASVVS